MLLLVLVLGLRVVVQVLVLVLGLRVVVQVQVLAQTLLSQLGHLPALQMTEACRLLIGHPLLRHTPHPLRLTRQHMWLGIGWGM
jgi:hypothetical protein